MANVIESQLVVLGGGPGGYAAAFLAADKGLPVTLVNEMEKPGGTCLHVGCIPSKALLHAARIVEEAREAKHYGLTFAPPQIDVNGVRAGWQTVVKGLADGLAALVKARKVNYVHGRGRFLDNRTLEITGGQQLRFQNCIVATGSSPAKPKALSLPNPRVMDSTGALALEDIPDRLLVVGGGYIGLEMGTVYAGLGSKVTVVEFTDGLLPGVDRDLVLPLHQRLAGTDKRKGLFENIYLRTKVAKLEDAGKTIKAHLEGEEVQDKVQTFDRVLISVGRRPNSAELGLEKAGVQVDEQGFIRIDRKMRTSAEGIYAIGDVAGQPMLAHKASYEGRIAVEVILGEPAEYDVRAVPAVVFTDPEIAWCGLTETEAKAQKREVKKVRYPWTASGRAMSLYRTEGATKLLVDPDTEQILGVGIVGVGAGELLGEALLAIEMGATARDIALTMHPHPTLSETVGEATELIYGTATHYKGRG
jgi:dihydrolipoamide dehydrogenase